MSETNIFADSPREGQTLEEVLDTPVDKEEQDETPAESQTEKEIETLELPDKETLKQNSAWERMRVEKEESDRKLQDLESRLETLSKNKEEEEIEQPEFLTDMIGKNEEVTRKWYQEREQIKEEVKRELVQAQVDAQKKEQETRDYWAKWTDDQFKKVGVKDQNERNELAKVMNDYTPTDAQGNLDYTKGMKLLTDLKKAQAQQEEQNVQVKKNVADATVSKETSTKTNKGYVTSHDLRKSGWRGL